MPKTRSDETAKNLVRISIMKLPPVHRRRRHYSGRQGIVIIHAHTTFDARFHLTALSLRAEPTPTIAPVIEGRVVETGIPAAEVANSVNAPAVSAQTPPTGRKAS